MKKTLLLLVIILCFIFNAFSNEKNNQIDKSIKNEVKKISFAFSTEPTNNLAKKVQKYSNARASYTAASIVFGVALAFFLVATISYFLIALIAPAALGVSLGAATTLQWGVLAGIMVTSFIPLAGPFIGAGLVGFLSVIAPISFIDNSVFYGSLIAMCALLGISEVTWFIIMVAMAAQKAKYKRRGSSMMQFNAGPYIKDKDNYGFGLKISFRV